MKTSKAKLPRKEMMKEAQLAAKNGSVLRIFEKENPHHGRIIQVTEKGQILIVR